MSYDLVVFEATAAPDGRAAFMSWYDEQTQWAEAHDYNDPSIPSPQLQGWFQEMIKTFPPMNGPLADDDGNDSRVTDYSLGQFLIYGSFAWSQSELAYQRAMELAAIHRVGLLEVSSTSSQIWLPASSGKLVKMHNN